MPAVFIEEEVAREFELPYGRTELTDYLLAKLCEEDLLEVVKDSTVGLLNRENPYTQVERDCLEGGIYQLECALRG